VWIKVKKIQLFDHKNFAQVKNDSIFASLYHAKVAQLVERQPSKLNVASSNLVFRSKDFISNNKVFFYVINWLKAKRIKVRSLYRA
jgi:hypothetical protein